MEAGPRSIVIGIGNADRGDDGAGRAVARRLAGRLPSGVELLEHDGEATGLLAALEGATLAIFVDASASGRPPGTVQRFDVAAGPLPAGAFGLSTHGFGLVEAVELARALDALPARCVVYAIEGSSFESGAALSPAAAAAVETVADRIPDELIRESRTRHA